MQDYNTFEQVFLFFVRSQLDHSYVAQIDQKMEQADHSDVKDLIDQVKKIHSIRSFLTSKILEKLNNHKILHDMINATSVVQYNHVPENSTCIISNKKLTPRDGVLIMIDNKIPCTIHKIYKTVLYNFWYIVHMPEDIGRDIKIWLKDQLWYTRATVTDVDKLVRKIHDHNEHIFAKKAFVKLKNISEYIQNHLTSLPIN